MGNETSGAREGRGMRLATGLLEPAAYPHPVDSIEVFETHISWVLLTGYYAYKIKKPVDLGFVDFSTLELRRHFCEEEVRLNRRLAKDLYQGVVGITGSAEAPRVDGAGPIFEYAVKMLQFDPDLSLDRLLVTADVCKAEITQFATALAQFHLGLFPSPETPGNGSVSVFTRTTKENFTQLDALLTDISERQQLQKIRSWSEQALERLTNQVENRRRQGWVRECHGDLHCGNIARVQGQLVAFDCLEFNADLRWSDVIAEVSFLAMDLAARGREDLATVFTNSYLEITGDYQGACLLDFYQVHYSLVRAKVAAIAADQGQPLTSQETKTLTASDYLQVANALISKPQAQLIITHGLSGSGKTWLTDRLMDTLPVIRLRADVIRKALHGLAPDASSDSGVSKGLYTELATQQTYEHMAKLAGDLLETGQSVIIDATCLKAWQRELFRGVAEATGSPWHILDCRVPAAVMRERIERRQRSGRDASEADIAVLDHQIQTQDPLSADDEAVTIRVAEIGEAEVEEIAHALRVAAIDPAR